MRAPLLLALAALLGTATPALPAAGDPPLEKEALGAAREAARWVARQAIPSKDGKSVTFPEYAESPDEEVTSPLYAGSAGVLVFLENAAALLEDEELRLIADRAAAGLMARREAPSRASGSVGLYTGEAGVVWALLVRHRLRGDGKALAAARRVADGIVARMKHEGTGATWDRGNDVISGAAGTILALLEVAADSGNRKYAEAAIRAGRGLARRGQQERPRGRRGPLHLWWPAGDGQKRHYPNFSHGTSGVAYALARVAAATGDRECREAALAGTAWLMAHGKREDGTIAWCHHLPGGETSYVEGWCHGPTGTGRLFLALHDLTGERSWLDVARRSANWIREEHPDPGGEEKTRFYSPSLCCGAAGVLDFFLDVYRATGDRRYLDYARGVGKYLVDLSKTDGDGRKWTNYDRPDENGVTYHGVSLMLGTSGEGLALLRLAAADRDRDPVISLPDRLPPVEEE